MNLWPALSMGLTSCAILLLIWAALHDLAARTVPNELPAAILAIAICVRLIDHTILPGLATGFAIFALLFILWRLGVIGGGDVKLWSATAILIPPHLQMQLSCITRILLAGGILALLYLLLRVIVKRPAALRSGSLPSRMLPSRMLPSRVLRAEAWRISRKGPLPYAFAIAGGAIVTLLPISFLALR